MYEDILAPDTQIAFLGVVPNKRDAPRRRGIIHIRMLLLCRIVEYLIRVLPYFLM